MFQTKVKQEYIQQMQAKDFYQQWLEQALQDFSRFNQEFEAVKYTGQLASINHAVADAYSVLRNDLLEPNQYDKLFSAACDFSNKIFDFYHACTQPNSPINSQIHPVKLFNMLNLINYVIPRMYFLTIIGKIIHLRINYYLYDLDDNVRGKELRAYGVTKESLEKQSSDLLFDLLEGARGIQHPTKLIFFRKFLIQMLRPVLPPQKFQQFQLDNLIEMNRFWCRTAFDPARTKAEERRRDDRRKYLGDLIYTGFLELAKSSVATSQGAAIFYKVLEQLQLCGDQMVTSHLMNAIAGEMDASQLLKNLGNILRTVCTYVSGVGTFIKLLEKLSASPLLTEAHFDSLCGFGMNLATKIVEIYQAEGHEELLRQISIGGELVSSIKSPWLAILSFLMKIGSKLWPEDLSKISFAFDLIIQVLFPEMGDALNGVALGINENAICFVEDEQAEKATYAAKLSDYTKRYMHALDSESIADLMIAPLADLDESLIVPFTMLAPMIILREAIAPEQQERFQRTLARVLTERPLVDGDFSENREAHEQQGANVLSAVQGLLMWDPVAFSKVLHCVHGSRWLYEQLLAGAVVLPASASQSVIGALFFTLLRDGYEDEALKCLDVLDDATGTQIVCLRLEAAKISARRGGDFYGHLQRVFEAYEICALSAQQSVLLGIIVNVLLSIDLGDETETLLSRCAAAAAHLLQREYRCAAMACVLTLYRAKNVQSDRIERLVDEMGSRFGTEKTRGLAAVIMQRETVDPPVFVKAQAQIADVSRASGQTAANVNAGETEVEVEEEVQIIEEEIEIIEEVVEEVDEQFDA